MTMPTLQRKRTFYLNWITATVLAMTLTRKGFRVLKCFIITLWETCRIVWSSVKNNGIKIENILACQQSTFKKKLLAKRMRNKSDERNVADTGITSLVIGPWLSNQPPEDMCERYVHAQGLLSFSFCLKASEHQCLLRQLALCKGSFFFKSN